MAEASTTPLWQRALESRSRRATLNSREKRLARSISREHGVHVDDMLGRSREKRMVRARFHFIAVLRWSTDLSLQDIGSLLGIDHTTALYAIRVHESRLNEPEAA